ncbi:MAG: trehalose utilization protein ThuA [Clostridiales bacterium]|nr:trehalose utilization protein ThuA [Clostridiales bacterium]
MDQYVYDFLCSKGYDVTWIKISPTDDGSALTDEILENTEVLLWWGHIYHNNILDSVAEKVVARVNRGMGFFAMHSGHHCKPFKRLIGTTGNLSWREIGERERVWVTDFGHSITKGLGDSFVIDHEEMYGEPFDIPNPDELVFISWFQGGEVMRSGCVWKRGRGKVFFFRPGHETLPTYKYESVQKVIVNAIEYLTPDEIVAPYGAPKIPVPPEGDIKTW